MHVHSGTLLASVLYSVLLLLSCAQLFLGICAAGHFDLEKYRNLPSYYRTHCKKVTLNLNLFIIIPWISKYTRKCIKPQSGAMKGRVNSTATGAGIQSWGLVELKGFFATDRDRGKRTVRNSGKRFLHFTTILPVFFRLGVMGNLAKYVKKFRGTTKRPSYHRRELLSERGMEPQNGEEG